jgi:competence ComEA-like helix-hairpin-helix protein
MEASVQTLRAIGFSSKVSSNIQKYIASGGVIKNQQDIMRIYGMDSFQLKTTEPYIIYPGIQVDSETNRSSYDKVNYVKEKRIIDLNKATITELDALPGIGSVLADRIIKFRTNLGGFLLVEQLREIYGLPPETYEKIQPELKIETPPQPLFINEIDLTTFTHPYLHKRFINMIKAYKTQHGPFRNASDLRKVFPPDSGWCEKILPYIAFEQPGDTF